VNKIKLFLIALVGWLGLLFTAFIYYVAIAGIIALFLNKIKLFLIALVGWLGLLFTAFIYYVAIAGIIALF
jgi:hypothetical protein